jgi:hypothetical protein
MVIKWFGDDKQRKEQPINKEATKTLRIGVWSCENSQKNKEIRMLTGEELP